MANTKHGHSGYRANSPTYRSWASMKTRCGNKNDRRFHDYGGRGVSYDPRWEDFSIFLADMGERPEETTLDRIDGDKDYSKENCRWATPKQQANNRRMFATNKTGVNGVSIERNGYRAIGFLNGKRINLYCGPALEEAIEARRKFDAIAKEKDIEPTA